MPIHACSSLLLSELLSLLALSIRTAYASCFELPSCMICLDPWDQYWKTAYDWIHHSGALSATPLGASSISGVKQRGPCDTRVSGGASRCERISQSSGKPLRNDLTCKGPARSYRESREFSERTRSKCTLLGSPSRRAKSNDHSESSLRISELWRNRR